MDISLILVGIMILTYIVVEITQKPEHAIFFKGLASFSFILVWSLATLQIGLVIDYQILLLLGLVLGLLGDLILALRPLRGPQDNDMLILRGMALFSLGHFFYLLALLNVTHLHYLALILGLVGMGAVILFGKLGKFEMGTTKMYNYLYSFLLFFMVGQTLGFALETGFNSLSLVLFIGFTLFALSDLFLASIYYQKKTSKLLVVSNLVTYYGAQVLIALSILFL